MFLSCHMKILDLKPKGQPPSYGVYFLLSNTSKSRYDILTFPIGLIMIK